MTFSFLKLAAARLRGAYLVLTGGVWESSTSNANDKPGEQTRIRLAPHALANLEKQLNPPLLGNDAHGNDPHYVGYVLGQQRVLKVLRDGFMVTQ